MQSKRSYFLSAPFSGGEDACDAAKSAGHYANSCGRCFIKLFKRLGRTLTFPLLLMSISSNIVDLKRFSLMFSKSGGQSHTMNDTNFLLSSRALTDSS